MSSFATTSTRDMNIPVQGVLVVPKRRTLQLNRLVWQAGQLALQGQDCSLELTDITVIDLQCVPFDGVGVSIECSAGLVQFTTQCRHLGNLEDALAPAKSAKTNCPQSNEDLNDETARTKRLTTGRLKHSIPSSLLGYDFLRSRYTRTLRRTVSFAQAAFSAVLLLSLMLGAIDQTERLLGMKGQVVSGVFRRALELIAFGTLLEQFRSLSLVFKAGVMAALAIFSFASVPFISASVLASIALRSTGQLTFLTILGQVIVEFGKVR